MKILQLSKYYPPAHGGIELVAEFFSRASRELGHNVTVISLGSANERYFGQYGEEVRQCYEDIKLNSSPLSLSFYRQMKEILDSDPPDYIFVHLPHPFAHELCKWFSNQLKSLKTKIVGIYHSDIINQVMLRDAYNVHFSRHIDVYDSFICASPDLKNSSSILSKLCDNKVKVIPFCVDHKYSSSVRTTTKKFNGKFLTIGRMVPYKGYEFLIDFFNSAPYELTIIGNGPLKEKLKAIAGRNICFAGEISEEQKFEMLNTHDALIMSSINRAEAYGMTIVEAFSVGIPVIASDIDTGVSFLVKDGQTGLKFGIKDKDGLGRQIEKIKNEPHLASRLSQQAKTFFDNDLSFEAFTRNLKSFLR